MKLIDKDALVAEIERRIKTNKECMLGLRNLDYYQGKVDALNDTISSIDNLEVEESKLPNPRFPHLENIVDKVFGAGNLELWEYEDAEQLVLLAKEELLKDIDVKEVDLEKELIKWHKEHFKKDGTFIGMSGFYLTNNSQMDIAKHFFGLGLSVSNKAQKGE